MTNNACVVLSKATSSEKESVRTVRFCGECGGSGLNSIWQPFRNEVRIGQITIFLPLSVLFLHVRLNNIHEVSVIIIDEFGGPRITKFVAVVKQGVKAEQRKRVTKAGFDLWSENSKKISFDYLMFKLNQCSTHRLSI